MTLQEDLPYEDLSAWTIEELDRYYYPDVEDPQVPPRPVPWHRNSRVLFGLMSTAALAGVVATVLLFARETQAPELAPPAEAGARITATPLRPTPVPQRADPAGPAAPTPAAETPSPPPEPQPEAEAEAEAEAVPAAVEPTAPPAAPPPEPGTDADADEPQGPRINVTRSPMSFAPAARG